MNVTNAGKNEEIKGKQNMSTVRELKEFLDKFPDDMPVYCAQESILGDADHSRVIYVPLVICDGDLISDHDGKLYIGDLFDRI